VGLDRDGPEPLYQQLAAILRGQIGSGELPPRTAIPSINRLAADYGLAVVTVRKAIGMLVDEGLVITVSGKGTFVAR
jgi:GntR family transcriptional regulator